VAGLADRSHERPVRSVVHATSATRVSRRLPNDGADRVYSLVRRLFLRKCLRGAALPLQRLRPDILERIDERAAPTCLGHLAAAKFVARPGHLGPAGDQSARAGRGAPTPAARSLTASGLCCGTDEDLVERHAARLTDGESDDPGNVVGGDRGGLVELLGGVTMPDDRAG